jgi:hypothetical protein
MEIERGVKIRNAHDLRMQVALLEELFQLQEAELRATVKEIHHSMSVSKIIKNTVSDLGKDKEFKSDALGASLNFGAQFVLDKFMNKREKGIKGYLIHAGLKKLLSFFIQKNKTVILEKITR